MKKNEVLKIIDEVMNNREIDSIRNAILAIRNKVVEFPEDDSYVELELAGNNELYCTSPYFDGAKRVCIATSEKLDTGIRGAYWYE